MKVAVLALGAALLVGQAMASQSMDSSKDAKPTKEKPRMKTVEEVWGQPKQGASRFPKIRGVNDEPSAEQKK